MGVAFPFAICQENSEITTYSVLGNKFILTINDVSSDDRKIGPRPISNLLAIPGDGMNIA